MKAKAKKKKIHASFVDIWSNDGLDGCDLAMAVALLAQHWHEHPPEGTVAQDNQGNDIHNPLMKLLIMLLDVGGSEMRNPEFIQGNLAHLLSESGILPMYGMPTRVRNLYCRVPKDRLGGRDEALSIDRDLDLAVTEFAPGSRRTRDKRTFEPIGVVGTINRSRQDWFVGEALPYRRTQLFCPDCMRLDELPNNFMAGGQIPLLCPDCGGTNYREMNAVAPAAFRTDGLMHNAPEGDEQGRSGQSIIAAITQPTNSVILRPDGTNTELKFTQTGRVFRINDNAGRGFSTRRPTAQESIIGPNGERLRPVPGIVGDPQLILDPNPAVGAPTVVLVAPKTTDTLHATIVQQISGLVLNPTAYTHIRAAYYSAATLLVREVSDRLDIDPEEIEIASIHGRHHLNLSEPGEILFTDHLPNGAGFVEWMQNNWRDLLRAFDRPVN